jgi:hypothetical protein
MPKRALAEKRPWLLLSLAAAIAYYILKDADFPGTYLLIIEAGSILLLLVYAVLRHHDADSRLLAGALAAAGLGVVAVELDPWLGALLLIVGNGLAIGLFLRHRRETPSASQKGAAVALLLLVPLICWRLPLEREAAGLTAVYGLSLGGMAGAGWTSAFPRYRVGIGASLYTGAGILGIAGQGVLAESPAPSLLTWPLFYVGLFLVATCVTQKLRADFLR